jgi:uncharacterized membrane protein YkvA (DUF1232 family)
MRERVVTIELNPREQRLYDRLRTRIVESVPGTGSGVRDLILLLPDLTILLARLMRDRRVPLLQKAIAIAGLAYVVSPIDLLPAMFFGPLGFLDDLFVVAACLSRLLNQVHPDVVRSHWSGQGDALEVIQRLTSWFEQQLKLRVSDLSSVLKRRRSG